MSQIDALEAAYQNQLLPKTGFLGLPIYNDPGQASAIMKKIAQLEYQNKYPVEQQGAVSAGQQVGSALTGLIGRYRGAAQANPNQGFLGNVSQALQGQGQAGMNNAFPAIAPQGAPQQPQGGPQGQPGPSPQGDQSGGDPGLPTAPGAASGMGQGMPADPSQQQPQPGPAAMPMPGPQGPARNLPGTMPQNDVTAKVQAIYTAVMQQTGDNQKATQQALTYAAQAGAPGAAQLLKSFMDDKAKNDKLAAETSKDQGQGDSARDEIQKRQFEKDAGTWVTTKTDPNGLYEIQQNKNGEDRRVELSPPPNASAAAAAALTKNPDAMNAMLDFYHTNGTIPPGVARGGPAAANAFWGAEGAYQRQTGNFAAAAAANKMQSRALTVDTSNVQKQLGATASYLSTMDKNIEKARALGNQLDFSNVTPLNQALQLWDRKTSNPKYAAYNAFFNSVATEYAKLSSGNMGNTTVSDSQRHETQAIIDKAIGNGGMNAIFDALKQEGANKVSGYQDHLAQNYAQLQGMGGNERQGKAQGAITSATTPTGEAPAAPQARTYNPATGKIE